MSLYKDPNTSYKAHDYYVYGLVSKSHTYADLYPEIHEQWTTMKVTRLFSAISNEANLLYRNRGMYQKIAGLTGVPWEFVAIVHLREAGAADVGRWQCVLHNGERIVGSNRRTTLVPKGRGPFSTFEDAAVDALKLEGLLTPREWSAERMLFHLEPYNGWGYRNRGQASPYIWSGTQWYSKGKYVADGVFDPDVVDQQVGCAPILHELLVLQGLSVPSVPAQPPVPTVPKPPVKPKPLPRPAPKPAPVPEETHRPPLLVFVVIVIGALSFLWFKFREKLPSLKTKAIQLKDNLLSLLSRLRP